jgi:hypothetical protein
MVVRLSALRTRHTLLPRNIIIFVFLVLISVLSKPQGLVRPEGLEENWKETHISCSDWSEIPTGYSYLYTNLFGACTFEESTVCGLDSTASLLV